MNYCHRSESLKGLNPEDSKNFLQRTQWLSEDALFSFPASRCLFPEESWISISLLVSTIPC